MTVAIQDVSALEIPQELDWDYDPDWITRAACRYQADLFHPKLELGEDPLPGLRICWACPVRIHCAAKALDGEEVFGTWGGLTEFDRVGKYHVGILRKAKYRSQIPWTLRFSLLERLLKQYDEPRLKAIRKAEQALLEQRPSAKPRPRRTAVSTLPEPIIPHKRPAEWVKLEPGTPVVLRQSLEGLDRTRRLRAERVFEVIVAIAGDNDVAAISNEKLRLTCQSYGVRYNATALQFTKQHLVDKGFVEVYDDVTHQWPSEWHILPLGRAFA